MKGKKTWKKIRNTLSNQSLNPICKLVFNFRKFYEKSKNTEKPQKYDEAVDRLRSANQRKFQQKKMLE